MSIQNQEKTVNGKDLRIQTYGDNPNTYVNGESFARRLLAYSNVEMVKVFDKSNGTKLLIRSKENVKIRKKMLPDNYEIETVSVKDKNTYVWVREQ